MPSNYVPGAPFLIYYSSLCPCHACKSLNCAFDVSYKLHICIQLHFNVFLFVCSFVRTVSFALQFCVSLFYFSTLCFAIVSNFNRGKYNLSSWKGKRTKPIKNFVLIDWILTTWLDFASKYFQCIYHFTHATREKFFAFCVIIRINYRGEWKNKLFSKRTHFLFMFSVI